MSHLLAFGHTPSTQLILQLGEQRLACTREERMEAVLLVSKAQARGARQDHVDGHRSLAEGPDVHEGA